MTLRVIDTCLDHKVLFDSFSDQMIALPTHSLAPPSLWLINDSFEYFSLTIFCWTKKMLKKTSFSNAFPRPFNRMRVYYYFSPLKENFHRKNWRYMFQIGKEGKLFALISKCSERMNGSWIWIFYWYWSTRDSEFFSVLLNQKLLMGVSWRRVFMKSFLASLLNLKIAKR